MRKGIIVLLTVLVTASFADETTKKTLVLDPEPPTGTWQYYSGLGLTAGGGGWFLLSILSFTDGIFPGDLQNSYDAYGGPSANSKDMDKFNRGFGIVAISAAVVFECVGIPLLVKGKRKRAAHANWEDAQKLSIHPQSNGVSIGAVAVVKF